jgi:hypothetical protein
MQFIISGPECKYIGDQVVYAVTNAKENIMLFNVPFGGEAPINNM